VFIYILGGHDLGENVSLPNLLRFITGSSGIPPMGLKKPIQLRYHTDEGSSLPYFAACANTVYLPICYSDRGPFFDAFRKALTFGGGFGSV
jgi:hypothetical protein